MTTLKNMLAYRGLTIAKWHDISRIAVLAMPFVILPSVGSNELLQRTVSGKKFFLNTALISSL